MLPSALTYFLNTVEYVVPVENKKGFKLWNVVFDDEWYLSIRADRMHTPNEFYKQFIQQMRIYPSDVFKTYWSNVVNVLGQKAEQWETYMDELRAEEEKRERSLAEEKQKNPTPRTETQSITSADERNALIKKGIKA